MIFPPAMLSAADQQRASCDADVRKLSGALKGDLNDGLDPTYLWYSLSTQFALRDPTRIATTLAAAVLQLAQKPTSHPKGRVEHGENGFTGTCGCCGHLFEGDHFTVLNNLDRHMRTGWKPA
jgi:hypothetical protein